MSNFVGIIVIVLVVLFTVNSERLESRKDDGIPKSVIDFVTILKEKVHKIAAGINRKKIKAAMQHFFKELLSDNRKQTEHSSTNNLEESNTVKQRLPLKRKKTKFPIIKKKIIKTSAATTPEPNVLIKRDISKLQTIEIIVTHGYKVESHIVFTKDGYILEIYRIINPSNKQITKKKKLVILQHGLMGSSDDWLILGLGKSLPYILLEMGYEVWLSNARGNRYTRSKSDANVRSIDFWDFSFHEIGTLDLPAVIDYIKNMYKDIEMHCIGHSLGGTALLVLLSTIPEYNKILKSVTLLAPLAFLSSVKGPMKLLADMYKENSENFNGYIGVNEIFSMNNFPRNIVNVYCLENNANTSFSCMNPLLFLSGDNYSIEKHQLRNILGHVPTGMSAKTLLHLLQLVNSGNFQMYDYGDLSNSLYYRTIEPAKYALNKINTTINIISSSSDWLATPLSIVELLNNIPEVAVHEVVPSHEFGHTDFVWGDTASFHVYSTIVNLIEKKYSKKYAIFF